jgi:hypothetical protein
MLQLKPHSQANTPTLKQLVFISAKRVALNYLEVKPSFTQGVAGHLFMHQLKMMPLNYWKIDLWRPEFAQRYVALHADHTLDMYSKAKAMPYLPMSVGALTP